MVTVKKATKKEMKAMAEKMKNFKNDRFETLKNKFKTLHNEEVGTENTEE